MSVTPLPSSSDTLGYLAQACDELAPSRTRPQRLRVSYPLNHGWIGTGLGSEVSASCPLRVKIGRIHVEQMTSALVPIADM
jgi:hypothetical protein